MLCPVCNGEMWDNRENKKNPKAPDFKCKDKACDGVIWPPRGKKPVGTAPQSNGNGPKTAPATGNWPEERSARIERQHSQSAAIAWFELKFKIAQSSGEVMKMPTTTELREMTSWLQRDIGHSCAKQDDAQAEEQF